MRIVYHDILLDQILKEVKLRLDQGFDVRCVYLNDDEWKTCFGTCESYGEFVMAGGIPFFREVVA